MDTRLIPYLQDHKSHTNLGNEVGNMMKELTVFEAQIHTLRASKGEEWYESQRKIVNDRIRRLEVFRTTYDYLDGVTHDALLLRRKITFICKTLRDQVLEGNKFPSKLTADQAKVMGEIMKSLASTYTENQEIMKKTNHTIEL
jgi:hypothetical protein